MAQTASNTPLMVADRPASCIKMVQTSDQATTTDNAPVQVTLASKVIDAGGTDMHGSTSSGGYIEIDAPGVYRLTGMANATAAARGGDRNVIVFGTTGTPNPMVDSTMHARFEVTSNNSTTRTGGGVTVWVSAAHPGASATCRIVTNQGRTDDRTIRFVVADR